MQLGLSHLETACDTVRSKGKFHRKETAEAIAMLEQQRATPSEAAWQR